MAGKTDTGQAPAGTRVKEDTESREVRSEETEAGLHRHSLDVPMHIPYFTPGDVVANSRVAASRLPVKEALFYGGLGALVVGGALEWPVAVAVGGATAIVRAGLKKSRAEERRETEERAEQRRETEEGAEERRETEEGAEQRREAEESAEQRRETEEGAEQRRETEESAEQRREPEESAAEKK